MNDGKLWLYMDGVPVREIGDSPSSRVPFADFLLDAGLLCGVA